MKRLFTYISIALFLIALLFPFIKTYADVPVLTNDQKLSLATSTPVGTIVQVSDGFVVSGVGIDGNGTDVDGFYAPDGTMNNGRVVYAQFPKPVTGEFVFSDGGTWEFGDISDGTGDNWARADAPADTPWDSTWLESGFDIVFTHPPLQQLTTPSASTTAVYISGSTDPQTNGIYTQRGLFNGKPFYDLIGTGTFGDFGTSGASEISWGLNNNPV